MKKLKSLVQAPTDHVLLVLVLCAIPLLSVGVTLFAMTLSSDKGFTVVKSDAMATERVRIPVLDITTTDGSIQRRFERNLIAMASANVSSGVVEVPKGRPVCELLVDSRVLDHFSNRKAKESIEANPKRFHLNYRGNQTLATFCVNTYNPVGIGNALSIYWSTRAIAFFEDYTFILPDSNLKKSSKNATHFCRFHLKIFDRFFRDNPRPRWNWFLPTTNPNTLFTDAKHCLDDTDTAAVYYPSNDSSFSDDSLDDIGSESVDDSANGIWKTDAMRNEVQNGAYKIQRYFRWIYTSNNCWSVPYWCPLILLQYNPYFMPTIRRETVGALVDFFEATGERMPTAHLPDAMGRFKLVIHVRCGDTLVSANGRRILLSLRFYQKAAAFIWSRQPPRVRQWAAEHSEDVYVELISQLAKSNAHLQADIDAIDQCTKIVQFMADTFRTQLFAKVIVNATVKVRPKVVIRGNSSADADFFRMVTAPNLISSASSFSLNAALAADSDMTAVVFPSVGPWQNIASLLSKQQSMFDNHLWVDVVKAKMTHIAHSFYNRTHDFKEWFPNH